MKCEHYQLWISDEIDGALADEKKRRLEAHLSGCPGCRAYRRDLRRIQTESGLEEVGSDTADYFEKFTAAVEKRLRHEVGTDIRARRTPPAWRWAWASAPLALALILGIILFRGGTDGFSHEILSFEHCLERVYQEIGENDDSAAEFSRFLSGSLLGGGDTVGLEDGLELWSDPFFWRILSDDELRLVETGIKNEDHS